MIFKQRKIVVLIRIMMGNKFDWKCKNVFEEKENNISITLDLLDLYFFLLEVSL